jgi:hypothetical protein
LRVLQPPIEHVPDADGLAEAAAVSLEQGASASHLFSAIAARLSPVELQTLYALARG